MLIKLRSVAGRNMSVEMGEGATVLDTLSKVCEEYGYKLAGSKLVLGGTTLDEAVGVAEALRPFADAPAKPSSPRKLSQKESARRQRLADGAQRAAALPTPTFIGVKAVHAAAAKRASKPASSHDAPPSAPPSDTSDLSNPYFAGPLSLGHREAILELRHDVAAAGGPDDVMALLAQHPVVVHVRALVQIDGANLAPALQQINALAPGIIDGLKANVEAFLQLLNEPVPRHHRLVLNSEGEAVLATEDSEDIDGWRSFGVEPELTAADIDSLNRVFSLGDYPQELVLQAFLEAGRNEHIAAQYLIDASSFGVGMYETPYMDQSSENVTDGHLTLQDGEDDDADRGYSTGHQLKETLESKLAEAGQLLTELYTELHQALSQEGLADEALVPIQRRMLRGVVSAAAAAVDVLSSGVEAATLDAHATVTVLGVDYTLSDLCLATLDAALQLFVTAGDPSCPQTLSAAVKDQALLAKAQAEAALLAVHKPDGESPNDDDSAAAAAAALLAAAEYAGLFDVCRQAGAGEGAAEGLAFLLLQRGPAAGSSRELSAVRRARAGKTAVQHTQWVADRERADVVSVTLFDNNVLAVVHVAASPSRDAPAAAADPPPEAPRGITPWFVFAVPPRPPPGQHPCCRAAVKRLSQLSADDAEYLRGAPAELHRVLVPSGQAGGQGDPASMPRAPVGHTSQAAWACLGRMHHLVFGGGSAAASAFFGRRTSFSSNLSVPFHALTPTGGAPAGRGRCVTQNPSATTLAVCQEVALLKRPTVRSANNPPTDLARRGSATLRATFYGNAPGCAAAKKVLPEDVVPGESLSAVHFGKSTSGGASAVRPDRSVFCDVAVYAHGVLRTGSVAAAFTALQLGRDPWCCSAVASVTSPADADVAAASCPGGTVVARSRAARDGNLLLQAVHKLLAAGESKTEAYRAAVAAPPDAALRTWVPWIFAGTRLPLVARRSRLKSDKMRATDDYRYLEVWAFTVVEPD
ncbi:putative ubiquitin receptor RAD23a [Diplonema papillatum]|nr:putative ubiquitin receptor RAD23a [Diplonema papillatum]